MNDMDIEAPVVVAQLNQISRKPSSPGLVKFDVASLKRLIYQWSLGVVKNGERIEPADSLKLDRLLLLAEEAGSGAVSLDERQRIEFRNNLTAGELPSAKLQRLICPRKEPMLSEAEKAAVALAQAKLVSVTEALPDQPDESKQSSMRWRYPVVSRLRRLWARWRSKRSG
jgi:hypothetical protein